MILCKSTSAKVCSKKVLAVLKNFSYKNGRQVLALKLYWQNLRILIENKMAAISARWSITGQPPLPAVKLDTPKNTFMEEPRLALAPASKKICQ
jgi:hypothetical protein